MSLSASSSGSPTPGNAGGSTAGGAGAAGRDPQAPKATILVVDDEASIRRILETRLTMVGYTVACACDGEEALEMFASVEPDLVVLDVMMPRRDGYGVVQELQIGRAHV